MLQGLHHLANYLFFATTIFNPVPGQLAHKLLIINAARAVNIDGVPDSLKLLLAKIEHAQVFERILEFLLAELASLVAVELFEGLFGRGLDPVNDRRYFLEDLVLEAEGGVELLEALLDDFELFLAVGALLLELSHCFLGLHVAS